MSKNRSCFLLYTLILVLIMSFVSAERLPIVGGDDDTWGTILNDFLNVSLNDSGGLESNTVSTLQITDDTITDTDISDTTNLTLGEKITFTLGESIDNIVNGWIRIIGNLNVTTGGLIMAGEFSGPINWTFLQNYPVVCPSGTFLIQLDDSTTCTAPVAEDIDPGTFPTGNYTFQNNVTILGTLFGGSPVKIAGGLNVTGNLNAVDNLTIFEYLFLDSDYSIPPGPSKILRRNSASKAVFGVQNLIGEASTDSGAGYVLNTSVAEYRIDLHSALDLDNPNDTVHHLLGANNREIWRLNSNSDSSFRFEEGLDSEIIIINRTGLFVTGNLTVDTDTFFIDSSSDRVGIGTTNPLAPLHVNSTSNETVLRLQDSDGACLHNPEAGSETVSCSSDEKLKEDIKEAESVLEEFEDIEIKDYVVKASGKKHTGVIAQEIRETNPEMVHVEDGELFVEQPNPWKLLKAIQELEEKIEELQAQIDVLENPTSNAETNKNNSPNEVLKEIENKSSDVKIVEQNIPEENIAPEEINNTIPVEPANESNNETLTINKTEEINDTIVKVNVTLPENNASEEIITNGTENSENNSINNSVNPITGGVIGTNNQNNIVTRFVKFIESLFN